MKDILTLRRNDVVTLRHNRETLTGTFKAGEQFKFLRLTGYGVWLSRIGDNAKLGVVYGDIA